MLNAFTMHSFFTIMPSKNAVTMPLGTGAFLIYTKKQFNSLNYSPNQFIMKKKVFSLMMTLVLAFMGVARAEIVEIGDGGTTTNSYLPSYSFYNYSLSQQIYSADEIGTAGTINSIAFYNGGSEKTRTYDLYLVNTTKNVFADNFDWIPVTAADKVFSGEVTMVAGDWTTITFDTPFAYDGVSNLAVVVDDNTNSWSSGMSCRVFNANGLQAIRVYSDPTNYDPADPSNYSGTVMDVKNQIQLDITAGGGGGETVEVTIGDPSSTTTNSYLPTYSLYDYSFTQQIYTADEIGVGGTINAFCMWLKNTSSYARNLNVYMKEVNESAFASGTAWVSMTASDLVATFTLANGISAPVETTVTLSTPFAYTGNGNLVICVQDVTGSWSSGAAGVTMAANGNQAMYAYRDGTVYDPTNPGVTGYTMTSKNVVRLQITTAGGGEQGDQLHVKYMAGDVEVIDELNLGVRPAGAWMEPL